MTKRDLLTQILHQVLQIGIDIKSLKKQGGLIMTDLTQLQAAVQKDTDVDTSAMTLLKGLKDALDAAGTDPVALKSLSDQLGSNSQALADAITANTPAA